REKLLDDPQSNLAVSRCSARRHHHRPVYEFIAVARLPEGEVLVSRHPQAVVVAEIVRQGGHAIIIQDDAPSRQHGRPENLLIRVPAHPTPAAPPPATPRPSPRAADR